MKELFGWHRLPKRKLKAHYFQNGYPLCGNIYVKEVATHAPDAFIAYTGPSNGKCLSCRYDYAVTHDALREIRGPIIKIDESNDTTTMPDIHLPHGKFTIMGKSKRRREFEARRILADQIECAIPCEREDCHHYEEAALREPENQCKNKACPWRPFLMAYEKCMREKRP